MTALATIETLSDYLGRFGRPRPVEPVRVLGGPMMSLYLVHGHDGRWAVAAAPDDSFLGRMDPPALEAYRIGRAEPRVPPGCLLLVETLEDLALHNIMLSGDLTKRAAGPEGG